MRITRALAAAFAATLASLALAAPAGAKLPEPQNGLIKPVKSLGGVDFGYTLKQADRAWGKTGDCEEFFCQYMKGDDFSKGYASISSADDTNGKVVDVSISAATNGKGEPVATGPMAEFETKGGVGLGDKGSKVKKEFKNAKLIDESVYVIDGKGKSFMSFVLGSNGRISSINLGDGKHQG